MDQVKPFSWTKLGRIVNPSDFTQIDWISEFAQSPSVIVFDKFVRVYFCSRAKPDENGQYKSRLGYVDLDRENLLEVIAVSEQPILELGELGAFDEHGTYPVNVITFKSEIWAFYCGWSRSESVPVNTAIGVAKSFDMGVTFKRLGKGPVIPYTPFEPFTMGSPKVKEFNGKLYLWYVAGKQWLSHKPRPEPVYKLRMAISDDGLNWTKIGKDLVADVIDENECQASAEVMYRNNLYHMFFSYRHCLNFKDPNRGYKIGYAWSKDLVNWQRNDNLAGIAPSTSGWDQNSISYPHIFDLYGRTYMLYQGNAMGQFGFGLARLDS